MGKIVKYCSKCEESFAEKFTFCPNCAEQLTAFEMKPVGKTAEPTPEPDKPAILDQEETLLEVPQAVVRHPEPVSEPVIEAEPEIVAAEPEFEETVVESSAPEPVQEAVVEEIPKEEATRQDTAPVLFEEPAEVQPVAVDASDGSEWVEETIEFSEPLPEEPKVEEAAVPGDSFERAEPSDSSEVAAAGTFLGLLHVEDKANASDSGFEYDPEAIRNYNFDGEFDDDNFHVTVISERSSKVRNGLLLGAFTLIFCGFLGLIVFSLFNNLDDVGGLVDDQTLISMLDEPPLDIEKEEQKKDDDDGGGGGGGGKQEEKPISKGELPTQTRPPLTPPSPTIPRLTNPSLPVVMSTEGDNKRERILPPGLPTAISDDPSSGPGSGGGMGRGTGTGLGDGNGTGEGNGNGSGSGNGNGNGNGNGSGDGNGRRSSPPPSGPTRDIQILSKPRPGYTDEARQNNVRGTVILRVTFLANGSIGPVSPVKGLPYGLTEKAIAAARQIRFSPKLQNGQPVTVNKVVHFNFTIY